MIAKFDGTIEDLARVMEDIKYRAHVLYGESVGAAVYLVMTPRWKWACKVDWADRHFIQFWGDSIDDVIGQMINAINKEYK